MHSAEFSQMREPGDPIQRGEPSIEGGSVWIDPNPTANPGGNDPASTRGILVDTRVARGKGLANAIEYTSKAVPTL